MSAPLSGFVPRRLPATLAAALTLSVGGVVAAPASHATGVDITCLAGSSNVTYDPPLTNTLRDTNTTVTNNFSCTSLLTGVSSGTATATRVQELSCLLALTPPTATSSDTYTWNTGQTSTATYVSTTVVRAVDGTATVTAVGSITSGLGQGSSASKIVVIPQLSLTACATTGLEETNGVANLVIVPV
ncbi:hypothetical protein [Streptomyces nitrosporeus]|uniref:hypothetical protein n=1 Tax=Streptomyces nitrosporeus TaxID=28894 RepID=UPI0039A38B18